MPDSIKKISLMAAVIGIGIIISFFSSKKPSLQSTRLLPTPPLPSPLVSTFPVVVHIAGAIVSPGVYSMTRKDRVIDLLATSGGLLSSANIDKINLAKRLRDGQRLYIPFKKSSSPHQTSNKKININTASATVLTSLSGIGLKTAAAIIAYRHVHGPFNVPDDLQKVKGIGPHLLANILSFIQCY